MGAWWCCVWGPADRAPAHPEDPEGPGRAMSLADLAGGILIATTRLLCGPQARWVGCEPSTRQRIYFANHCSHLDAVVLWSCLPPPVRRQTRPVAALDYWGGGGLKGFLAGEVFHSILVDRSGANPRSVIDHLVESMGPTSSIIFFPEETRGAGQEVACTTWGAIGSLPESAPTRPGRDPFGHAPGIGSVVGHTLHPFAGRWHVAGHHPSGILGGAGHVGDQEGSRDQGLRHPDRGARGHPGPHRLDLLCCPGLLPPHPVLLHLRGGTGMVNWGRRRFG